MSVPRLAAASPGSISTGRVLPPAGSAYVPSTKSDPSPHDYTGTLTAGALYPACMVADRNALLAIGGFDERSTLRAAAEDNDLCYRWLSSGRSLRYEPDLVVWHHDWRTPEELVRTHAVYTRAQGAMYAKHLYGGDRRVLRLLAWDLRHGLRSVIGGDRRVPRWKDPYREMVTSLLVGLCRGWREERRLDARHRRLGSLCHRAPASRGCRWHRRTRPRRHKQPSRRGAPHVGTGPGATTGAGRRGAPPVRQPSASPTCGRGAGGAVGTTVCTGRLGNRSSAVWGCRWTIARRSRRCLAGGRRASLPTRDRDARPPHHGRPG